MHQKRHSIRNIYINDSLDECIAVWFSDYVSVCNYVLLYGIAFFAFMSMKISNLLEEHFAMTDLMILREIELLNMLR